MNTAGFKEPPSGNARKIFCKRGHLLSGENLYRSPDGHRHCRICTRLAKGWYRAREKVKDLKAVEKTRGMT